MTAATRSPQRPAVEFLEAVLQHRSIRFFENVESNLDAIVRPDAQDIVVKRGVMKLAKSQTVRHDRKALGVPVGQDVRRLKQFLVT